MRVQSPTFTAIGGSLIEFCSAKHRLSVHRATLLSFSLSCISHESEPARQLLALLVPYLTPQENFAIIKMKYKGGIFMGELYKAFLNNRKNAVSDENTSVVLFDYKEHPYRVIMTRKRATRLSLIRCAARSVVWEQIPFLYLRYNERGRGEVIQNIPVAIDKSCVTVFVVKGKPRSIWGLDEGIFRSANKFDKNFVNVMSEKRFKRI